QGPPGRDQRACTAYTLQARRVVLLLCPRLPNICAIQKLRCGVLLMLARPSSAARSARSYSAPPFAWNWKGLVSKHRDRPYQAGRSKHWVRVKYRKRPAMYRVMDALAQAGLLAKTRRRCRRAVSIGGGWWHQPMPAPHINPPVMI